MNWYRANIPDFEQIDSADRWPSGNPKIRVPALLIWGEADRTFVPEFLVRVRDYASNLRIVQLPGVGHWTSMEDPSAANAAIADFLHLRSGLR